jgi:hypothetical protein
VSVSQLKLGFCVSQYWNHPTETGKATGPVVPFEVVVAAVCPSWLTAPAQFEVTGAESPPAGADSAA